MTLKQWVEENLADYLLDLVEHGAIMGYPGITYYRDTVALYEKYSDEIWGMLCEEAEEFGDEHPLAFMTSFNGAKDVWSYDQFANLLVWYAVEEYARRFVEERREEQWTARNM